MLKNVAFAAAYDGVFVIKLSLKHLFIVELSNVSKKLMSCRTAAFI